MAIRFIHTSDWQIGKVFKFVSKELMGVLQEARLSVIGRIGNVAAQSEVSCVLVAGDVFDMENMSDLSLRQPLERMRKHEGVHWYLLPGNHDPDRPNGLWNRLHHNLPGNVHLLCEPAPVPVSTDAGEMFLLPAPLKHKHILDDPTEYMDHCELPENAVRIGVAHGSVAEFGSDAQPNYISPDRPSKAALAYLALGDWHGQKKINSRCWYSGTPETDGFSVQNGGKILLVEVDSHRAEPKVTPIETGSYAWRTLSEAVHQRSDVEFLRDKLHNCGDHLEKMLIRLEVTGSLSLVDRVFFDNLIADSLSAAFFHLEIRTDALAVEPTEEDLDTIDFKGIVRDTADRLTDMMNNGDAAQRSVARDALRRLYAQWSRIK